ncbi:MAG: hypothetical protein WC156_04640 [Pedobacter sp.]
MKRFLLLGMAALLCLLFAGCGDTGSDQPSSYVGVFKSVETSNNQVIITITKDDGTLYRSQYKTPFGTYSTNGTWGVLNSGPVIKSQLDKGYDKYFIDFSFSLLNSAELSVSGTAIRQ